MVQSPGGNAPSFLAVTVSPVASFSVNSANGMSFSAALRSDGTGIGFIGPGVFGSGVGSGVGVGVTSIFFGGGLGVGVEVRGGGLGVVGVSCDGPLACGLEC